MLPFYVIGVLSHDEKKYSKFNKKKQLSCKWLIKFVVIRMGWTLQPTSKTTLSNQFNFTAFWYFKAKHFVLLKHMNDKLHSQIHFQEGKKEKNHAKFTVLRHLTQCFSNICFVELPLIFGFPSFLKYCVALLHFDNPKRDNLNPTNMSKKYKQILFLFAGQSFAIDTYHNQSIDENCAKTTNK